jgi:hypothetical protein
MLTAFLRPDLFDGSSLRGDDDSSLYDAADGFSRAFRPFSVAHLDDQKAKHLVEVFRSGIQVALWLYTQPSTFTFDWTLGPTESSSRPSRAVVTMPSLLKTHNEAGTRIDPPQVIQVLTSRRV